MLDSNTAAERKYARENPGLTDAEEADLEAAWDKYAAESLKDADWWNSTLEGICQISNAVPGALARCMANLDAACKGDAISTTAILTALSNLQRTARADARDEAQDKTGEELEKISERRAA